MTINPLADDRAMLGHLETAKSLAERICDQPRLVRALTYLAREHLDLGQYGKSVEIVQDAIAVSRALGDRALEVAPTAYLALSYVRQGDARRARDVIKASIETIPDGQRPDHHGLIGTAAVFYRTFLTRALVALGAFDEAIVWAAESLRLAEIAGHPYGLGSAYLELGGLHVARGAVGVAIPLLERGFALSRTRELRIYIRWTAAALALAYVLEGRSPDAQALLDEMPRESFGPRPKRSLDTPTLLLLSATNLYLNRLDATAWFARRALEIAREFNQRGAEAAALQLGGDLLSRYEPPDFENTEKRYREALALANELGMRPLVAHCHLGLGKVYRRTGQSSESDERLTTAMAMYREMGMTYWLEKATAEMGI